MRVSAQISVKLTEIIYVLPLLWYYSSRRFDFLPVMWQIIICNTIWQRGCGYRAGANAYTATSGRTDPKDWCENWIWHGIARGPWLSIMVFHQPAK
jgi:hypothetical protein